MTVSADSSEPDELELFDQRRRAVRAAFSPTAPISQRDLFAGRNTQMWQLIEGVDEPGQHLILFGERGVGKTSLATIASQIVAADAVSVKINCSSGDTFSSIWRRVFAVVKYQERKDAIGFNAEERAVVRSLADSMPDEIGLDDVRAMLETIASGGRKTVIFIDEFDTVRDHDVQRQFADSIKTLSDQIVPATIVLVGVAESVEQLIEEHASVERALAQINMPRMSQSELASIVRRGLQSVAMTIDPVALSRITSLSQGLPHYTHLLAQTAALAASDENSTQVDTEHVRIAMKGAVDRSQESIAQLYSTATYSARENLYREVLVACACARSDDRGYFSAAAVREAFTSVLARPMDIPQFAMHLNAFSTERGPVLRKVGSRKRFRYRFTNPLLQPYVLMRGIQDGIITPAALDLIES